MVINFLRILILVMPLVAGDEKKIQEKAEYQNRPSKNDKKVSLNFENANQNFFEYPTQFSSIFPDVQGEKYGPLSEKQTFSRIQPQLFLYPGNFAPGQQFLLQPATPPNNFLIPQPHPGTDIILRDIPHFFPPNGYPRPGNAPPVEKDAEEIPTDQIGVHQPSPNPKGKKPEKLETFDTDDSKKKTATEVDVLNEADKNYKKPVTTHLQPGQRFFFLNGQTLYPSFEGFNNNFLDPFRLFDKHPQQAPEKQTNLGSQGNNFFLYQNPLDGDVERNPITGHITNINNNHQNGQRTGFFFPDNSVFLNQPSLSFGNQDYFNNNFKQPTASSSEETTDEKTVKQQQQQEKGHDNVQNSHVVSSNSNQFPTGKYTFLSPDSEHVFGNGHYPTFYDFNSFQPLKKSAESIALTRDNEKNQQNNSPIQSSSAENGNPTISQAQPQAIAIAGSDGVASAGPKAVSITGQRGTALSSPSATAIAGAEDTITRNKFLIRKPFKQN